MGFKIYLIAITNAANVNTTDIPNKIGFDNLQPANEISISEAQYENGISIGKYDDTIFIVSSELVFEFYHKNPSELEKKLTNEFPNSEIAILTLNQTTDFYGYNIITNGKRKRVRSGADTEIEIDFGEKLPEELDISKDPLFGLYLEELKEFQSSDKDFTKKQMKAEIEQEIGVRTFFKLTSRYFGKPIDENGTDYNEIKVTKFE
ncbi:hypothetical protein DFQ09_1241 [Winogradskyella pacifica]|uniref:Uncharacterized protein n=1 Tax=Winogradskyella pacifica TaxID=664642 RepID=A0A3D9LHW7_9FLAO|nr:hypothetical protein [Winogradskyella pacifica]REE06939.1 hypothetical protein DFQ09_1241 [Winogradskyella pacifica]